MNLTRLSYIFLFFTILLGLGIRVYNLDKHGIFLDEKATILISQGMALEGNSQKNCFYTVGKSTFTPKEFWAEKNLDDFYDSIRRSDIGNSPFYYLVLHNWIKAFGISDYSIRFLSVFFSCLTIILLFFFIKEHLNNLKLALLACILMAIEPFFIAISQQTRNYSMSFFLTLLATHIFLKIIKNEETEIKSLKLYWFYGILSALCLLSHFLTATVFMVHGLYVLLFVRKSRPWYLLPSFLMIGGIAFGYWITYGGGDYTFQTLNYQAKIYYTQAHLNPNPHAGYIDPATVKNVTKKAIPIFTDLFISMNNLTANMVGKKNILLALAITVFSIFSLWKFKKTQEKWWLFSIIGVNMVGFFVYSTAKWQHLEIVNGGMLFYLFIEYWRNTKEGIAKKQLWLFLFLTLVPTIFLIIMTFKNGHTFGLTQRYSGFSFPYSIILVSIALLSANQTIKPLNYFIWVVFGVQLLFVGKTIKNVLNDESLKYNYRDKARVENPYPKIALELTKQYQTGDTIVYPSYLKTFYEGDSYVNSIKRSVLDAQYVNLYLPKDAEFIQTIDNKEVNKVILRKKDGKRIEIFDLKGDTFRY
ncbi:glycosyltransferase family 39 protein [Arcicella sp. LKC2W]|uniref:glycosyltransferase family 39 protein n=1 Tax=Arcicella sp. LKC2W TaxID=2984198 RepID=UPI002B20C518|nr:glycosyltransferase family 39 protein [Arcicella sp. LKC2W]MEA5461506.1 glycosyltransferase family 39 protein [Arcicella sp. LKC2W]